MINLPSVFSIIRPTICTLISFVFVVNNSFCPRSWPSHVVILRDSPAVIAAPDSRTVASS